METESEDVQEQTTPMITDDLDSDVSMATAQSGSVPPTDVDMPVPSPAANVPEIKVIEEAKPLEPEGFTKIESVQVNDIQNDPDLATPKQTKIKDTLESVLEKYETDPMSLEDLRVLSECFFLPYEHGKIGKSMVQKFTWLRENAVKLARTKDKRSEEYLDKVRKYFT